MQPSPPSSIAALGSRLRFGLDACRVSRLATRLGNAALIAVFQAALLAAFFAGCSSLRPAYAANRESSLLAIRFSDAPEGEPPLFTGADLKGIDLIENPITMGMDIELELFEGPAELFYLTTVANIGRSLELRFCGEYSSAATIQQPISNGRFRIQGSWSRAQVKEIAARIAGTR